jgi:hypothetical protein
MYAHAQAMQKCTLESMVYAKPMHTLLCTVHTGMHGIIFCQEYSCPCSNYSRVQARGWNIIPRLFQATGITATFLEKAQRIILDNEYSHIFQDTGRD